MLLKAIKLTHVYGIEKSVEYAINKQFILVNYGTNITNKRLQ